ncbi:hypothetical protein HGRIS_011342 [Hohenbuehelia grisea]|uniref:Fungal lipase-type domain-containing protein n=1 Tax=Hohenbuehelia grisea TaxID=104357 RepID=A0ABR3JW63_9AGAR
MRFTRQNVKAIPYRIADALTPEQRAMYSAEKLVNFRWIAHIIARYSPYTLSPKDRAPDALSASLAEIGQFAEVVYSPLPIELVYPLLETLTRPTFPLEGYTALSSSTLVSTFHGTTARLPGLVAYRPPQKQLILAVSGTARTLHAFYDLHTSTCRHPSGHGRIHRGFFLLYQGFKARALDAIMKGLGEYGEEVEEVVLTGHSMGGAVVYLLALDMLRDEEWRERLGSRGKRLKLVVFGVPRCGDVRLQQFWRENVDAYHASFGENALAEFAVKAYNDGVAALPPLAFGFRHFARSPYYFIWGHLYRIPQSESEYTLFHLSSESELQTDEHPSGETTSAEAALGDEVHPVAEMPSMGEMALPDNSGPAPAAAQLSPDPEHAHSSDANTRTHPESEITQIKAHNAMDSKSPAAAEPVRTAATLALAMTGTPYPRGGHNYYNGRELEGVMKRMRWLDEAMTRKKGKWTERKIEEEKENSSRRKKKKKGMGSMFAKEEHEEEKVDEFTTASAARLVGELEDGWEERYAKLVETRQRRELRSRPSLYWCF